jgi:hypothetical protein
VATTVDNKAQSYRYFRNAVIEAVTVPTADVNVTDPARLTVRVASREITDVKGDNATLTSTAVNQQTSQCSNFRRSCTGRCSEEFNGAFERFDSRRTDPTRGRRRPDP